MRVPGPAPMSMLHIATVHFGSPRWIPIQARELRRNMGVPYRTWASLQGIDPSYGKCFDRVVDPTGGHAQKLNHLASAILEEANDDDLVLFLDGDAFPVADPGPLIASGLAECPLLAVQRVENYGDPQPHPCFCVTKVETWRDLPGDWSQGFAWPGPGGILARDVGGNLLQQLERTGTAWKPVLRSNRRNRHPVFFGVYGDAIYHHGAGFRLPVSRVDIADLDEANLCTPQEIHESLRSVADLVKFPELRRLIDLNTEMSDEMFRRIERDDPGWLAEFI